MSRSYPSKVDGFVLILMLALPFTFLLTTRNMPLGQAHLLSVGLRVLLLLIIAFLLWTLLSTVYRIDATALQVRSGPFHWTIALRDIRSVTATRDSRSGPALSFDRLRIDYGDGRSMLISPREKAAFLRDLEQRRAALLEPPVPLSVAQ